jgi:hypothetical protein
VLHVAKTHCLPISSLKRICGISPTSIGAQLLFLSSEVVNAPPDAPDHEMRSHAPTCRVWADSTMAGFGGMALPAAGDAASDEERRFLDEYEYVTATKGGRAYFQCLGSGGFGVVFRARQRATGAIFAAKRMQ